MKKFALICMSLFLMLGLAACQNTSKEQPNETTQQSETTVDPKTLPENHSVDAIKARGELIIALPKDCSSIYVEPNSAEYHGYNAEFAKLAASEMGVKATFVKKGSIVEALDSVEKGDADIAMSNFNLTTERMERFSASDNYLFMESDKISIFVFATNAQKFNTKEGLNTAKIAVIPGAAQTEVAKKNFPDATYLEFSTTDECWEALKSGKVDVIIAPIQVNTNTSNADLNKAWDNKVVVESEYDLVNINNSRGYMMMKGNTSLTSKVNELIKRCLEDGSYKKWYTTYIEEAKKLGY